MAKSAASKDNKIPRIGIPADPKYFGKIEPRNSATPSPKPEKISRAELVEKLKATGTGWDAEAKELLAMPEEIFMLEEDGATYYCDSEDFSVFFHLLSSLSGGKKIESLPEFGLALYSTGGSVFMVFADGERNIVLKNRMFCIHDEPQEKDWESVRETIRELLKIADEKKIGVYNLGMVETVK